MLKNNKATNHDNIYLIHNNIFIIIIINKQGLYFIMLVTLSTTPNTERSLIDAQ